MKLISFVFFVCGFGSLAFSEVLERSDGTKIKIKDDFTWEPISSKNLPLFQGRDEVYFDILINLDNIELEVHRVTRAKKTFSGTEEKESVEGFIGKCTGSAELRYLGPEPLRVEYLPFELLLRNSSENRLERLEFEFLGSGPNVIKAGDNFIGEVKLEEEDKLYWYFYDEIVEPDSETKLSNRLLEGCNPLSFSAISPNLDWWESSYVMDESMQPLSAQKVWSHTRVRIAEPLGKVTLGEYFEYLDAE